MYTILLNNDNYPITTVKERIIQNSNLVDKFRILVYPIYKTEDMKNYDAYMEYITPSTSDASIIKLNLSSDTYREYLKYELPIDSNISSQYGSVKIRFLFTCDKEDEDGSVKRYIRRTSSMVVTIHPPEDFGDTADIFSGADIELINKRIKYVENEIGRLNNRKADNIELTSYGLQLQANNNDIGNTIAISRLEDSIVNNSKEGLIRIVEF